MTSAITQPRNSALVQADIDAFEAIIQDAVEPPPGDRAAQLQWEVWQNHRAELKNELAAARHLENGGPDALAPLTLVENLIEKVRHFFHSHPSEDNPVARNEEKNQAHSQSSRK